MLEQCTRSSLCSAEAEQALKLCCGYRHAGPVLYAALRHVRHPAFEDASNRKMHYFAVVKSATLRECVCKQFAVEFGEEAFFRLPDDLHNIPRCLTSYVQGIIPSESLASREFMMHAAPDGAVLCAKLPGCLARAPSDLQADKQLVLGVVSQPGAGSMLAAASPELRKARDVAFAAVRADALSLWHVLGPVRHDVELLRLAATSPFQHAGEDGEPNVYDDEEAEPGAVDEFLRMFKSRITHEVACSAPDVALLLVKRLGWRQAKVVAERFVGCDTFVNEVLRPKWWDFQDAAEALSRGPIDRLHWIPLIRQLMTAALVDLKGEQKLYLVSQRWEEFRSALECYVGCVRCDETIKTQLAVNDLMAVSRSVRGRMTNGLPEEEMDELWSSTAQLRHGVDAVDALLTEAQAVLKALSEPMDLAKFKRDMCDDDDDETEGTGRKHTRLR